MSTPSERGWGWPGAPGSLQERSYRQQHIATVQVAGIRLHVRREVAHLFVGFLSDLTATGYRLDVNADDWGWANRDVRGAPGVKSNHAWGLAIDVNAMANPMTEAHGSHAGQPGHDSRGVHTDMPPETGLLASKWGLRWGANYSGTRKDAMHFEFMGAPTDVSRYPLDAPSTTTWRWHDYMPKPDDFTSAAACPTGGYWMQKADGSIFAFAGAPWIDAYNAHPELGGNVRYFVALVPTPNGGYVQIAQDGATYHFNPSGG